MFAVALANMWVAYFIEPAPTIELHTFNEPAVEEIPVDTFSKGPFNFTVKGNNYVLLQRQLGSELEVTETVAYTYAFFLAVFVIGMLAAISTLPPPPPPGRFYYLVGHGVSSFCL